MKDYYYYLWCTTWPYLVVLFLLIVFLVGRLFCQVRNTWRYERDAWGLIVLSGRTFIYIGTGLIYIYMLLFPQRDWFATPAVFEGVIEKVEPAAEWGYYLEVRDGEVLRTFQIKTPTAGQLEKGDRIELEYLPYTGQVIKGEVAK